MASRVTWGIYRGFNPRTDPTQDWRVPTCMMCSHDLLPWVDWVSHGCIGYCPRCRELLLVWSFWEPHPDFHSRQEKYRLLEHHTRPLGLRLLGFDDEPLLWKWHESIPSTEETIREADRLRREHRGEKERLVVLEHLLWSIIWNTDRDAPELLEDYLRFTFDNPHFVKLDGRDVFIGYEVDLAVELERRYGARVLRILHDIYREQEMEPREFRMRLGFYLPTDQAAYEGYPDRFVEFAMAAQRRI